MVLDDSMNQSNQQIASRKAFAVINSQMMKRSSQNSTKRMHDTMPLNMQYKTEDFDARSQMSSSTLPHLNQSARKAEQRAQNQQKANFATNMTVMATNIQQDEDFHLEEIPGLGPDEQAYLSNETELVFEKNLEYKSDNAESIKPGSEQSSRKVVPLRASPHKVIVPDDQIYPGGINSCLTSQRQIDSVTVGSPANGQRAHVDKTGTTLFEQESQITVPNLDLVAKTGGSGTGTGAVTPKIDSGSPKKAVNVSQLKKRQVSPAGSRQTMAENQQQASSSHGLII